MYPIQFETTGVKSLIIIVLMGVLVFGTDHGFPSGTGQPTFFQQFASGAPSEAAILFGLVWIVAIFMCIGWIAWDHFLKP